MLIENRGVVQGYQQIFRRQSDALRPCAGSGRNNFDSCLDVFCQDARRAGADVGWYLERKARCEARILTVLSNQNVTPEKPRIRA